MDCLNTKRRIQFKILFKKMTKFPYRFSVKRVCTIHSHNSSVVYAASGTQYMFSICKKEPEIAQELQHQGFPQANTNSTAFCIFLLISRKKHQINLRQENTVKLIIDRTRHFAAYIAAAAFLPRKFIEMECSLTHTLRI